MERRESSAAQGQEFTSYQRHWAACYSWCAKPGQHPGSCIRPDDAQREREPDGSATKWESYDGGKSWAMVEQAYPNRSAAARRRLIVQRRKIMGWHIGVFRNDPFVVFDFGRVRIEVAYV